MNIHLRWQGTGVGKKQRRRRRKNRVNGRGRHPAKNFPRRRSEVPADLIHKMEGGGILVLEREVLAQTAQSFEIESDPPWSPVQRLRLEEATLP